MSTAPFPATTQRPPAIGGVFARGVSAAGPGRDWLATLIGAARSLPPAWLLAAIVLLGAALRLHDAGADGFWKNELFSMVWSRQPLSFLLGQGLLEETNPPLHFIILKAWTALFGGSEFAARTPSVIASIAAIPLAYLVGRDLLGARAGLLAALLLAVTPVQIYFAHEARAYALMPAFALLAMLGAARLLAAAAAGRPASAGALLLYVAGGAGLVHSHAAGMFAVAALFLASLAALRGLPGAGMGLRRLLGANAAVALLGSPVVAAMVLQSGSANIDWMPALGWDTALIFDRYLLIGPMVRSDLGTAGSTAELLSEMGLASVTALALTGLTGRSLRTGSARALLFIFPLLFVALIAAVSLARPVLVPRIAIWLSPVICLGVAAVLTGRLWQPLRIGAGLLLATCVGIGLWNNVASPAQHKPDWRALLHDYPPAIADGTTLVGGPHAGPLGIFVYADGPIRVPLFQWVAQPERPVTLADRLERTRSGAATLGTPELGALIAAGGRVVLYLDDDDEPLVGKVLREASWFAGAEQHQVPGLRIFVWPARAAGSVHAEQVRQP